MITAVPDALLLTIPVVLPTVAIVAAVLHVPPVVASVSVVPPPAHIVGMPVIMLGNGFMVITAVVMQPAVVV